MRLSVANCLPIKQPVGEIVKRNDPGMSLFEILKGTITELVRNKNLEDHKLI